jgi:amino acid adenylation domain-containing protein/thioester reductase-like protein
MKLLFCQPVGYLVSAGGAQKANRMLIEALAARGHACRFVGFPEDGPRPYAQLLDALATRGVMVRSAEPDRVIFEHHGAEVYAVADNWHLYAELARQIREFAPDWTIISEDRSFLLLAGALANNNRRVVYIAHGASSLPFGPQCFFKDPSKTELLRQAAGIITVGRYMREYIRRWGGLESVGLPFPVYGDGPFSRFGRFDEGYITLVNPCVYKGSPIFLGLARRLPDVPFAAVPSWGTSRADLDALHELPNVLILPPADNIDAIFAQTRILLMPSLWSEAFPLTPVEAMLRGIPVLASALGGLIEAKLGVDYLLPVRPIERYEEVFNDRQLPRPIVPEQDIGPWLAALRTLLTDRARYEALAQASREAAQAFVDGISAEPFERYLEGLAPAEPVRHTSAAPTPGSRASLAAQLAALSPEKRTLMALRLRKKEDGAKPGGIPRMPRWPGTNRFPTSFAQQRLLFLDQLLPGGSFYNVPTTIRMVGPLDLAALAGSINAIVQRHEALRTTFASDGAEPAQVIAPALRVPLRVCDLRALPVGQREAVALELAAIEGRRPFDLARGPLVRSALLRLADEEQWLLLTIHHIVCDGWSMGIVIREALAAYEATVAGRAAILPALLVQYADFAAWQREWMEGTRRAALLDYWRQRLSGRIPALDLPTDRRRPANPTQHGATRHLFIDDALTSELKALSQQRGGSLFMTLLAAFGTLLGRYTGQTDMLIGTSIANRTQPELEGLIGFFTNTLLLRADLRGDPSFRTLLDRVRDVALGAYAHQELPFEQLVEELMPERNSSLNPLFQVMFVLQNAPMPPLHLPGLTLSPIEIESGTAKFDLSLDMVEATPGLLALLEYPTELYDAATIDRMLGHLRNILAALIADCDLRLSDLPLLSASERRQVLVEWNDGGDKGQGTGDRNERLLHLLFEAQVARTPDAISVTMHYEPRTMNDQGRRTNDESSAFVIRPSSLVIHLTYRELNERANRLAHNLRARGVGPETRVVVCMERSPELIVAPLGVLKAGGTYIPLDPVYPAARLEWMIKDAQPTLLIDQSINNIAQLDVIANPTSNIVNRNAQRTPEIVNRKSEIVNPKSKIQNPENLAYIIYTSGSTGTPKGAMVTHAAFVDAYLAWENAYTLRSVVTCHLQLASCTFDVFSGDMARALCSGGKLLLCPQDLLVAPDQLYALMWRERVDCAEFVPAVLRNLCQHVEASGRSLGFMRLLLVGSDSWYGRDHTAAQRLCGPDTRLINSYGVTEATIDSTYFQSTAAALDGDALVPIGRPFPHTRVYLLDRHLQPVPIGVPGELCIGGAGLARGYLNRPDLTAERFVPNPFAEGQETRDLRLEGGVAQLAPRLSPLASRLYRTGDLARYRPDGTIEFLGRVDQQIKLRGFRIELGEVAAALEQHPGVREAVVVAREDSPGEARLIAYVVPMQGTGDRGQGTDSQGDTVTRRQGESTEPITVSPNHRVTSSDLRSFLQQRLPAYMLPSAFVVLDALPLTPNGKLDRRALPAPARDEADRAMVAPRDDLERAIAAIWQKLLRVERVGVHDDFFALGGHSLLASQLAFQLRISFQVDFSLRSLFDAPTVADLAQTIAALHRGERADRVAELDLDREALLDPAIMPEAAPAALDRPPRTILLTGATGFLGAFLLRELLDRTPARVLCLVRAPDEAAGLALIRRDLDTYGLWDESQAARIVSLLGDLSQLFLGLAAERFRELAGQLDAIFHCGAWVNFTYPYGMLKATNVLGTQEIVRLACQDRATPLHFVSTLSVVSPSAPHALVREDDPLDCAADLPNGYAQSKWVAERLLVQARARGLPVNIYRPGLIGGERRSGIGHTKDLVWAMIKGCIQLGSAPQIELAVDLAPVDYVSGAIVQLASQPALLGRSFHLSNPHPLRWSALVEWMRAFGYPLRTLPYQTWRGELLRAIARDPGHALSPFVSLFPDDANTAQLATQARVRFDDHNTRAGLAGTAIACPPIDAALLTPAFEHLIRSGFLGPPPGHSEPSAPAGAWRWT